MKPHATAMIDQARAASSESYRIMHNLAALEGTAVQKTDPAMIGPIVKSMVQRIERRAIIGQLTLCPHLSYSAPEPSFWCAWAPGRLRCLPCTVQTQHRIRGTIEDRRCDHCGKVGPTIHRDALELPPIVVDLGDQVRCIPPVIALFGLCPPCQKSDHALTKETPS